MNKNTSTPTEQNILEAAKHIFMTKGYAGAHMQEIAQAARINKALVHYYFRNKQTLFNRVFTETVQTLFKPLLEILQKEAPLNKKIKNFIDAYITMLQKNPKIPLFMLHELSVDKALVIKIFKDMGKIKLKNFSEEIRLHLEKKNKKIKVENVIVDFFSLLIFPFVAKDIFSTLFDFSPEGYREFLEERKEYLYQLIINYIS